MPRWIEVGREQLPRQLTVHVGDLLRFRASGGRVCSGPEVLQLVGSFSPAVVGVDGRVHTPAAAPSNVVFLARAAGAASIEVVTGDPWGAAAPTTVVEVEVEL